MLAPAIEKAGMKPGSQYDETRLLFIPATMRRPVTQPKVRRNAWSSQKSHPVSLTPFWRRPSAEGRLPPPRVFVGYEVSTATSASEQVHSACYEWKRFLVSLKR